MYDRIRRNDEAAQHLPAPDDRIELEVPLPRDDLSIRRQMSGKRPPLTRRERDERWPIG